jgi:N-acetylglutamate synthase-like GNAT family acetyltransferase
MLSGNHLIRKARPSDAKSIENLYRQLAGNPEIAVWPEQIEKISSEPQTALFIIEADGEIQGTALASICSDVMFTTQPFAVIENVIIATQVQGRGLGSALLAHIEQYCLEKDCSKIMLLSSIHRESAHHFFQRAGYDGGAKRGFVKYRSNFRRQITKIQTPASIQ